MVFNSISFFLFFAAVFILYWFAGKNNNTLQNWILLISSYIFYAFASLKIVPIMLLAMVIFYALGIYIGKAWDREDAKGEKIAGWLTATGVVLGVGFLLYFKYLNFFIQSFMDLFNFFGLQTSWHTMKIIMPLGISYFTFKLLAYVLEVQHGRIQPVRDFVQFATYIAFFPCIISGPIDRPAFMTQLTKLRIFDYDMAIDGSRQFLWGMFKKMAVADTLAVFVDTNLASDQICNTHSLTIILSIIAYTFQIYADFSGYSDMAIGVGKLLGLRVTPNFRYPFFALNVADFWRRWHMSLTGWMTDYVFMPLNLKIRNLGKLGMIVAIIVNFLIVGLWHGDSWNYAAYGMYHGILFIPLILSGAFYKIEEVQTNKLGLPVFSDGCKILLTFLCVVFGMIIFRSTTMSSFGEIIVHMGRNWNGLIDFGSAIGWLLVIGMMVVEWLQRNREYGLELSGIKSRALRWCIYLVVLLFIFYLGGGEQHFIYQVF